MSRLIEYHTWQNEVQMVPLYAAASKEAGKPITTLCAIVDMGGMTSSLASSSAWGALLSLSLSLSPSLSLPLSLSLQSLFCPPWCSNPFPLLPHPQPPLPTLTLLPSHH
jgi:hypothetical protein